jgi:transcriptional regulator NrdR family protein
MICKKCKGKTTITNTVQGESVERYRKCKECGANYHTMEIIVFDPGIQEHTKRAFENNPKLQQYIPK